MSCGAYSNPAIRNDTSRMMASGTTHSDDQNRQSPAELPELSKASDTIGAIEGGSKSGKTVRCVRDAENQPLRVVIVMAGELCTGFCAKAAHYAHAPLL